MDLSYTEAYEELRSQVRQFLSEHWPERPAGSPRPDADAVAAFRDRAIRAGYLARSVPAEYGGSGQEPDVLAGTVIRQEFRRARAPGDVPGIGPQMLVPTLLERGEEWQKRKFVPPTMRGEIVWCQGYSEPGAGSDLASLQTRAELRDGEWVIEGQKIWTSAAHRADYMFCLCRTEPEESLHGGISYLLIDMKQPGIDVQPLRQIDGGQTFNQVFFSDVRTPEDWIVGKRGEGWLVSRTTLVHERNMIGGSEQTADLFAGLVELARRSERDGRPALEDPTIRQRLASLEGYVRSHQYSGYVQLTRSASGAAPGPVQTMNKLVGTTIGQEIAKLCFELLGDEGLLEPETRPVGTVPRNDAQWVGQYMQSLGAAIAGGTANIQRNIIGERALGLPRDAAMRARSRSRS
jgi:alkylation response protein AidB-like acyl-CoA dehydrogenase